MCLHDLLIAVGLADVATVFGRPSLQDDTALPPVPQLAWAARGEGRMFWVTGPATV